MTGNIKEIKGKAMPMIGDDIDTDRIIPARFLRCVTFDGLGEQAFRDERFDAHGSPVVDHPMNKAEYKGAKIILSGNNFGCGSSREHAPIAIKASGVSIVIAKSFARIFYRNSINIGLAIVECDMADKINNGDMVQVDLDNGNICNKTQGWSAQVQPFPEFIQNIIKNNGYINSVKKQLGGK